VNACQRGSINEQRATACNSFKAVVSLSLAFLFLACAQPEAGIRSPQTAAVRVIYSTDLYSPPADPDDYFDLACLFALREVDLRAIILDNAAAGFTQQDRPGEIPLRQMEHITGRRISFAMGLREGMKSPDDQAPAAAPESQAGIELILSALRGSQQRLTIITVGSLRDVAVAFNRDP